MLTRKCDVCGREIGTVNAHYRLIFDGGFLRKEKDICISCFNRIKEEVEKPQQADTPHLVKTPQKSRESHEKDTPQTDCGWR